MPDSISLAVVSRAASVLEHSIDPDALHTLALSDLVWGTQKGKSLDRSISYLGMAARAEGSHRASVLSDLSAALLVRAERFGDARDLYRAVEAADSAINIDSTNVTARFNLALALESSGLDWQAIREWNRYLIRDQKSEWASEAKAHRDRLIRDGTSPETTPSDTSSRSIQSFAHANPQVARIYGLNNLLGDWGRKTIAGRRAAADQSLAKAQLIASVLVDKTLDAAIRSIKQSPHPERNLAKAHVAFADGQSQYDAGKYDSASFAFANAIALSGESPSLSDLAKLFYAATRVYAGDVAAGRRTMSTIAASAPGDRPALRARALWMLGYTDTRQGLHERAAAEFDSAYSLFIRVGEHEHAGLMKVQLAVAEISLGNAVNAYSMAVEALRQLRPYHRSVSVHSILAVIAASAIDDGLQQFALRAQTEGLEVATALRNPLYIAEARLAHARIVSSVDHAAALADLDSAKRIIQALPVGLRRDWFTADMLLTQNQLLTPAERSANRPAIDSAITTFDGLKNNLRLLSAILDRADASIDANDLAGARHDLLRATAILRSEHDSTQNAVLRQSLLGKSRYVFARAAVLAVAGGDTAGGLELIEQSRTSFGPSRAAMPKVRSAQSEIPPGITAIEYLHLRDTLFAWVVSSKRMRLTRIPLRGYTIADTLSKVIDLLEARAARPLIEAGLASLSSVLVDPIEQYWGSSDDLVFLGDSWVSSVPYSALKNRRRTRYLIEDHTVSLANQLGSLTSTRAAIRVTPALLVANTTTTGFDSDLDALKSAIDEIEAIRPLYKPTTVLTGDAANTKAFKNAFPVSSLVHFAGHAVLDQTRPMQSYLVLTTGTGAAEKLTADEIEHFSSKSLDLVVLSACETARPPLGRSSSINGLALAFLAAGSKGVVGSLWRVEDNSARQLMADFHRRLRDTRNPAGALRQAQLDLMHAAKVESPAEWAAFQLISH